MDFLFLSSMEFGTGETASKNIPISQEFWKIWQTKLYLSTPRVPITLLNTSTMRYMHIHPYTKSQTHIKTYAKLSFVNWCRSTWPLLPINGTENLDSNHKYGETLRSLLQGKETASRYGRHSSVWDPKWILGVLIAVSTRYITKGERFIK